MSRHRCNSCQGEYDDIGADGVAYFHACPPVVIVRVRDDAGVERTRPLRAFTGIALVASDAARAAAIAAGADPTTVYVELARRTAPRAGARDENTLRREGEGGKIRVLKASGTGTTAIASPVVVEEPIADAP